MSRLILIITLLASSIAAIAQTDTYTLDVGEFSRLKVMKNINVDYHENPDSAGTAVFRASASQASLVSLSNNNGELIVTLTEPTATPLPTLHIYSTFLTSVKNEGDSTVRVLAVTPCPNFDAMQVGNGRIVVRDLRVTRFKAKIATGNGQIIAYGKCDEASLSMTGTGLIQADGMEAATVKISAYGTGSIGCWSTNELMIHGMGSTKIFYKGSPKVRNKSLGVKVEPLVSADQAQ